MRTRRTTGRKSPMLGIVLISKAAIAPEPLRQWVAYTDFFALVAAVIVTKLMPPE